MPNKPKSEKKVKLSRFKLNPNNPRQISKAEMERLKKSIEGFKKMLKLRPIIHDKDNNILGGNMRFLALQQLGYVEVPALWFKCADDLTEDEKKQFIITDNGKFGDWDFDILANGWDDLPLAEWGVDIPKAWSDGGSDPGGNEPDDDPEPEKPQIILCPKCGHEFSILKKVDE